MRIPLHRSSLSHSQLFSSPFFFRRLRWQLLSLFPTSGPVLLLEIMQMKPTRKPPACLSIHISSRSCTQSELACEGNSATSTLSLDSETHTPVYLALTEKQAAGAAQMVQALRDVMVQLDSDLPSVDLHSLRDCKAHVDLLPMKDVLQRRKRSRRGTSMNC